MMSENIKSVPHALNREVQDTLELTQEDQDARYEMGRFVTNILV